MKFLKTTLLIVGGLFAIDGNHSASGQTNFWEKADGVTGWVYSFASRGDGRVYTTSTEGAFKSSDNGLHWSRINPGGTDFIQIAVTPSGSLLLSRAEPFALLRSTDDGISWDSIYAGERRGGLIAVNAAGHIFFSGFRSIYRSTDGGASWLRITVRMPVSTMITTMACDAVSQRIWAASMDEGGVYFVAPGRLAAVRKIIGRGNGRSWHVWSDQVQGVFAFPYNSSAASTLNLYRLTSSRIRAWKKISEIHTAGICGPGVSSFAADGAGNFYLGSCANGVLQSKDRGSTWQELRSGLAPSESSYPPIISSVGVTPDGHLLAGTLDGLFRSTTAYPATQRPPEGLAGNSQPAEFALRQNYPNPFNPTTTIEFELATRALVSVKIYNTLGQEVAAAVDGEEFGDGQNEVEFDGTNLPSGIYFFKLFAHDIGTGELMFQNVRKMSLIK